MGVGVGAAAVSVGLAFLATWDNLLKDRRQARLDNINAQLRELYGPLLAAVNTSRRNYEVMVAQLSPDGTYAAFHEELRARPEGAMAANYRKWVKEVFQPLNERASQIVIEHTDLLSSYHMPEALLQLVAHTAVLRILLQRWEAGEVAQRPEVSYPEGVVSWCQMEFSRIKRIQQRLLGLSGPKDAAPGGSAGAAAPDAAGLAARRGRGLLGRLSKL